MKCQGFGAFCGSSKKGGSVEFIHDHGITQNQLKTAAAIFMLIDHIGAELFPQIVLLRMIGRLAFPIFSFFVYEGFLHTRSKKRYLSRIFFLGSMCVAVYYLYSGRMYGNVLITFSLSIVALYSISLFRERISGSTKDKICGTILALCSVICICLICTWIYVDYGFWGVMMPVFAYVANSWGQKKSAYVGLAGFSAGLLLLAIQTGGIQYISLIAIPLLAMYNGRQGLKCMKSFFYWFYPAHLAAIGVLSLFV